MPSGLSTPDHSGTWSARSTISWLISPHEPLGELREGVGAHAVRRGDREVEEGAEDEEEGAQVHARERAAAVEEQEVPHSRTNLFGSASRQQSQLPHHKP